MASKQHKIDLINGLYQQLKPVFDSSGQSMYIYLDDAHKVCNKKFASLLKYSSPEEWAKADESFPTALVDTNSQNTLISAYQDAMEKMVGSTIKVTWKTKSGEKVNTSVILVPITYQQHMFALHFVSKL
mgnify:CR=1 FL=1